MPAPKLPKKIRIEVDVRPYLIDALLEMGFDFGSYGNADVGDYCLEKLEEAYDGLRLTIEFEWKTKRAKVINNAETLDSRKA